MRETRIIYRCQTRDKHVQAWIEEPTNPSHGSMRNNSDLFMSSQWLQLRQVATALPRVQRISQVAEQLSYAVVNDRPGAGHNLGTMRCGQCGP